MNGLTLREIARALHGEVQGSRVAAPSPGHSRIDRSLSVKLSAQSPTGFIVHTFSGHDFREARDYVASKLGLGPDAWKSRQFGDSSSRMGVSGQPDPKPGSRDRQQVAHVEPLSDNGARIARAVAIWNEAGDARGTIVERYLASRSLNLVDNIHEVIRFHPRCPWRDEEQDRTVYVPCMVALMRSVITDQPQAIHRTRLSPAGKKLGRRMLGIAAGAAVKIDSNAEVTSGLAIGEGVESCLAARQLGFRPVWA